MELTCAIALICKASLPSWLMPVHKFNYQVITQYKVYFTSLGSPVTGVTKHPGLEKSQQFTPHHKNRPQILYWSRNHPCPWSLSSVFILASDFWLLDMFRCVASNQQQLLRRSCSSIATSTTAASLPAVPQKAVAAPVASRSGSIFFERFSSFLVGSGLGFGGTFYFILEELRDSNKQLTSHLDKLNKRITAAEGKWMETGDSFRGL